MKKDKTLAGILSFFIPGVGQIYCGETGRGIWFIVGTIFSWLSMFILIGFVLYPAMIIWAIVDAVKCAERYNNVGTKKS